MFSKIDFDAPGSYVKTCLELHLQIFQVVFTIFFFFGGGKLEC